MAPLQVRLRKAIGLLKDQTSISIAKVASVGTPDLEIAILKATSHEEAPSEERYVQLVLHLTSFSRACVNACVCSISRRLSKTCNWIVAIKALILAHRLLRDGDAAFEKELMLSRRQGMRVLNVSDFRDESHACSWDFSAFVHAYGLYLDERLDCSSIGSLGARPRQERRLSYKDGGYEYSDSVHHKDGYGSPSQDYLEKKRPQKESSRSVKDMKPHELIENVPAFQRLLERVLACRPTGPVKGNRLTSVALYAVIRESFVVYADLRDGLAVLRDVYFDLDLQDCGKVLDIYYRATKLMVELVSFYSLCKALGVCRTAEYPSIEAIPEDLLEKMEDFLRNPSRGNRRSKGSEPEPEPEPRSLPPNNIGEDEAMDMKVGSMPALASAESRPPPSEVDDGNGLSNGGDKGDGNLVDVCEPILSLEDHGDKLALALFSGTVSKTEEKWEAFPSEQSNNRIPSNEASSWELALLDSDSQLGNKQNGSTLAGGFDHLLLESLYEQGAAGRHKNSDVIALASCQSSMVLALPAPPVEAGTPISNDPFSASDMVACPAYVQMSDMWKKQQLLVQAEQQQWMQYHQNGMQGYVGLMKYANNPFASPFQPTAYSVSYYNTNPFHG